MGGALGDYLDAVTEQWLKPAPRANPALVEMFRDRDRRPLRDLTMFAGEFAGKYLTGAVQVLRLTGDPELRGAVAEVVRALVACQGEDGYLGPWPSESGLTNRAPNSMLGAPLWSRADGGDTWDTWGHYHLMLGLLLWHEDSGDGAALQAARRMADLLCERYLGDVSPRLVDTGWPQCNLAPAHSLALLYRTTGQGRYLQLAEQLIAEFGARGGDGAPLAGDYLHGALAGRSSSSCPPRAGRACTRSWRWRSSPPSPAHRRTGTPSSGSGGASPPATGATAARSARSSRPRAIRTPRARSRPAARSPGSP